MIFVFDPFGVEGRPQTPEQAMAAMGALREDNDALRARLAEALAVLTREAGALGVPADRLAAFGFCFGGACVLELARAGADLRAFVSFHGLLDTPRPAAGPIKGAVLVLNNANISANFSMAFTTFSRWASSLKVLWYFAELMPICDWVP